VVQPLRDAAGQPLGVDRGACYHHKRIVLDPGDVLLLYSDGLLAAVNERGEIFGCERLSEALRDAAGDSAAGIKAIILGHLDEFLKGRELEDDVTVLVVQREIT
jgi:sigma-B regulation protein RsbU (phosphoserine phosphatase)